MLGFLTIVSNLLCEFTNNLNTFSQNNSVTIVANFVGFYIMIEIKDFYLGQRSNFPIKKALADPLVINKNPARIFGSTVMNRSDEKDKPFNPAQQAKNPHAPMLIKVLFYVYRLLRALFCSFYFYFFPLLYLYRPFQMLVLSSQMKDHFVFEAK